MVIERIWMDAWVRDKPLIFYPSFILINLINHECADTLLNSEGQWSIDILSN